MQKGLVLKSTGKWYKVQSGDGEVIDCNLRGRIRLKGLRTTNPIAAGDIVNYELEEDGKGAIRSVEPRKNYIIRRSVNLSSEAHIIASNIDQALLFVTLLEPDTSTGFVDRFLVTADAFGIEVVLIFNKVDIYSDTQFEKLEAWEALYQSMGYRTYRISALKEKGMDQMNDLMKGKTNLLSGHSGVGKSTLVNAIEPGLELKTAEVSDYHKKGQHTTTFAEMHPLKNGGYIIDTPGIKGFGLVDIDKEQLHHHFKEFFALLPECKFHNCKHLNEPGCAVKKAVENGQVAESRYKNYLNMYYHDEENPYR